MEKDETLTKEAREIIEREKLNAQIIWHEKRGASTSEAEQSLGVTAADIAKTIVFIASDKPAMVIIMGDKRVDTKKLKTLIGSKVRIANAEEVLKYTGHRVGGVTPLGSKEIPKFIDESVLKKAIVYSSAGSPFASLKISVEELIKTTKGKIVDVSE